MAIPATQFSLDSIVFSDELRKSKIGPTQNLYTSVRGKTGRAARVRFQMSDALLDPYAKTGIEDLPSTPFKLSEPIPGAPPNKRSLGLSIPAGNLQTFFMQLDNLNLKTVFEGRNTFFPKAKDLTKDGIEQMYTSTLRMDKEGKYDPVVSVKVRLPDESGDDDAVTEIFVYVRTNVQANGVPEVITRRGTQEDLKVGNRFAVTVESSGLWFLQRGFGMSLVAKQILVYESPDLADKTGMAAFGFAQMPECANVDGDKTPWATSGVKRERHETDVDTGDISAFE